MTKPPRASETPLTDAVIYPTTARDCVTGCEIPVVHLDDCREIEIKLRKQLSAATAAIKERDEAIQLMMEKNEKGTLHVGYCNGHPDFRVGDERYICNCTLGVEIKALRNERNSATAALEEARDKALEEAIEVCKRRASRFEVIANHPETTAYGKHSHTCQAEGAHDCVGEIVYLKSKRDGVE